ncbi:MAG: Uncharacterized MFS-type transporter, partial [uncultured Solirubrobacteraceae bacterium]
CRRRDGGFGGARRRHRDGLSHAHRRDLRCGHSRGEGAGRRRLPLLARHGIRRGRPAGRRGRRRRESGRGDPGGRRPHRRLGPVGRVRPPRPLGGRHGLARRDV